MLCILSLLYAYLLPYRQHEVLAKLKQVLHSELHHFIADLVPPTTTLNSIAIDQFMFAEHAQPCAVFLPWVMVKSTVF